MAKHINIQIQPFSGDPNLVTFFFEQIKEVRSIYKLTDKETLALFKSKLVGPALQFFLDSCSIKNKDDLDASQKEFEKFFKPINASTNINEIKIEENESLNNFSLRIDKALCHKYPKLDQLAICELKKDLFVSALPKNIKIKILEHEFSTFDEILEKAEQLKKIFDDNKSPVSKMEENFHVEYENTPKRSKFVRQKNSYKNNSQKFQHKPKSDSYEHFKNNKHNSHRPNRNIKRCNFCSRRGHLMPQCYDFLELIGKRAPRHKRNYNQSDESQKKNPNSKENLNEQRG